MVKQIMATHDQGNGMKQAAEERNSLRCKLRFQQHKQVLFIADVYVDLRMG